MEHYSITQRTLSGDHVEAARVIREDILSPWVFKINLNSAAGSFLLLLLLLCSFQTKPKPKLTNQTNYTNKQEKKHTKKQLKTELA